MIWSIITNSGFQLFSMRYSLMRHISWALQSQPRNIINNRRDSKNYSLIDWSLFPIVSSIGKWLYTWNQRFLEPFIEAITVLNMFWLDIREERFLSFFFFNKIMNDATTITKCVRNAGIKFSSRLYCVVYKYFRNDGFF